MQIKEVEFRHEDERGLFEQVTSGMWQQLNILRIKEGHIRGGHYHKVTNEFFYVLEGTVDVEIDNVKTQERMTKRFAPGDCFTVDAWEKHTVKALSYSILVVLLSERFNPDAPDIYT